MVYPKSSDAFVDGGDVCFTGKEFFIGLSTRTNAKGAEELQAAFPDIPVTQCEVKEGLHLKSSMTMLDQNTIIVGTTDSSKFIKQQIIEKSKFLNAYKFVDVDDVKYEGSANVLFFNNRFAFPAHLAHVYESMPEFKNFSSVKPLPNSELFKIDGCLTCRSVFFCSGGKK